MCLYNSYYVRDNKLECFSFETSLSCIHYGIRMQYNMYIVFCIGGSKGSTIL